jgi:hypothetical protein
LFWVVEKRNS